MTDLEFKEVKENYLDHIKEYIKEVGNLFPHITIFANHKNPDENSKPAIIHIPIPAEYMENETKKDLFLETVAPEIFKTVKEDFIPKAVAWGAEAWMRVFTKDDVKEGIKDYKSVPVKKEIIFIILEAEDKQESLVYIMNRNGKQVNSSGDLTDIVELEHSEELSTSAGVNGRFSGLFKMLENA